MSQTSKIQLFDKKNFQPSTISVVHFYTKSFILDVRLRSKYAYGAVNYFREGSILMFEWVLDTPLTCLKKDKNCKKPVNE